MASETPNRVRLRGRDDRRREGQAAGTITPGDAVEVSGVDSGTTEEYQLVRQSTAAEVDALVAFAVEYAGTGRSIDDDYSNGDNVMYFVGLPGDVYYAHHNTAEDVAVGDKLVLAGDGTLRAIDTDGTAPDDNAAAVVGEARSAVSNATGTEKSRVKVEVV